MTEINLLLPTSEVIQIKSTSDLQFDELARSFLSAYIPGLKFFETMQQKPDFIVSHVESDKKTVELKNKEVTIYDAWNNNISFDLYHLVYSIARILFINKNTFPIHSSCVDHDGLVLIVGHSGSGKTTAALNMITKYNSKWASGNKTLLGFTPDYKIKVLAGTETATIKQTDESAYVSFIGERIPYFDRLAFKLKDNYMYSFGSSSVLKSIVLIGHLEGISEFKEINSLGALHALYPFFLDVVNADTVLCDGKAVYSQEVSLQKKEELASMLEESLKSVKIYSIKGSKDFVFDSLSKV